MTPRAWWTERKTEKQTVATLTKTLERAERVIRMANLESFYLDLEKTEEAPPPPVGTYDEIINRYVPKLQRELQRKRVGVVRHTRYRIGKKLAGDMFA